MNEWLPTRKLTQISVLIMSCLGTRTCLGMKQFYAKQACCPKKGDRLSVAVCPWLCKVDTVRLHIQDPVISVRVLRLFHNNWSGYSWYVFTTETMYNLLVPNYCYWLGACAPTRTFNSRTLSTCTVLCRALNMQLRQVSLADRCGQQLGRCLFGTVQLHPPPPRVGRMTTRLKTLPFSNFVGGR